MDTLYLAAVCAVVPGLGRSRIPDLINALGSARAVFEASAATLTATGLCTPRAVQNFISNRDARLPQRLDYFCRHNGVQILAYNDASYPQSLQNLSDKPLVLYVKGELPQANYALAIVGSRRCTEYGVRAAAYFAQAMTREGIPIISGGAKGIDTAAHEACLQAGGVTVAVLGCGLDIAYPPENARLFARIAEHGALVTEYPPGVPPAAANFPARNRIIVGLSQAVLVAEAGKRSGAVITANIAADEGREVYCVPGNIFDGSSIGCHELIRTGAKLVDMPQDILDDKRSWQQAMNRRITQPSIFDCAPQEPKPVPAPVTTELGAKLLALLQAGALSLEKLTEQSGAAFAAVSMELLDLQAAGLVAADQAQRYYRK
ncbi:DNA-processing protein DprA [Phascolarctobacterium succinatutens]|uniref:DNA-processing protein DprA n=1 Tax=Phascolarctobacterium succinatutens TaxID=626940 RepID=UPI0026EA6C3A|nr:DNA-processing protein DprA [Phascolarctobacterium succinatutens]